MPSSPYLQGKRHVHGILLAEGVGQDARIATIREMAERRHIPIQTVPVQGIENIVGKVNHQGVLATTDRYGYTSLRAMLDRPGTILRAGPPHRSAEPGHPAANGARIRHRAVW